MTRLDFLPVLANAALLRYQGRWKGMSSGGGPGLQNR